MIKGIVQKWHYNGETVKGGWVPFTHKTTQENVLMTQSFPVGRPFFNAIDSCSLAEKKYDFGQDNNRQV